MGSQLKPEDQAASGQFFTPEPIASFMAGLFDLGDETRTLLDPGAGVGNLTAAMVARWSQERAGETLEIVALEQDQEIAASLRETLEDCQDAYPRLKARVEVEDFIEWAANLLVGAGLYSHPPSFDLIILNPPYRKLSSTSRERALLRQLGIEPTNLYAAFLALCIRLLRSGGQLVAITPRSFSNGPYFRTFRRDFLDAMSLKRIHLFQSRTASFRDDDVLQENVIFLAVKDAPRDSVVVTLSDSPRDDWVLGRTAPYDEVVRPSDPESFIRIAADDASSLVAHKLAELGSIRDAGVQVATGRVVDFRARDSLVSEPDGDSVPLIYPANLKQGRVLWPSSSARKPVALLRNKQTESLLLPSATYVLVKRFTSKEERKRIVASVFEPQDVPANAVGFENHLNVFHVNGRGLPRDMAWGLAAYLNSVLVDMYFRSFSGHTQVNATDLRLLPYPSPEVLASLGATIEGRMPPQEQLDELIGRFVPELRSKDWSMDPVAIHKRIGEAVEVLRALGLPKAQLNERSALALLALAGLAPAADWAAATAPMLGITQMMGVFRSEYGKDYAPNTRETVRRQSVHQFLAAGIIIINPDDPNRPVNSGKTVYQIESRALTLLQSFGTPRWAERLEAYSEEVEPLRERWARERQMARIPVVMPGGEAVSLSPGGQNVLLKEIVEQFCSRHTPGGRVLYVGDADEKFAIFEPEALSELGVTIPEHGKMPDLVVSDDSRRRLILVEAVTSHGPIDPKRREELSALFSEAVVPIVFVTAFLTRRDMARFLETISWETDVWVAEDPTHLIHFNGE